MAFTFTWPRRRASPAARRHTRRPPRTALLCSRARSTLALNAMAQSGPATTWPTGRTSRSHRTCSSVSTSQGCPLQAPTSAASSRTRASSSSSAGTRPARFSPFCALTRTSTPSAASPGCLAKKPSRASARPLSRATPCFPFGTLSFTSTRSPASRSCARSGPWRPRMRPPSPSATSGSSATLCWSSPSQTRGAPARACTCRATLAGTSSRAPMGSLKGGGGSPSPLRWTRSPCFSVQAPSSRARCACAAARPRCARTRTRSRSPWTRPRKPRKARSTSTTRPRSPTATAALVRPASPFRRAFSRPPRSAAAALQAGSRWSA
mmetsp:Transcript_5888/g.16516  ORF Transcript_5888/g.16516 Transcript_5888/m.16516 type:complete len:322 (-) Transcript_5888:1217-2182(-)